MLNFRVKIKALILTFAILAPLNLQAQAVNQSQKSFKRNAAAVIFASLGGGVLGLSTLSFYGKPQEHTDNITTGVALGLVAGLIYVFSNIEEQQSNEVRSPWIPQFLTAQARQKTNFVIPVLTTNFEF